MKLCAVRNPNGRPHQVESCILPCIANTFNRLKFQHRFSVGCPSSVLLIKLRDRLSLGEPGLRSCQLEILRL